MDAGATPGQGPTTKFGRVVFPYRSRTAGQQPQLSACRAWRVIARPAGDFGAAQPAVLAGDLPAAPAACRDGIYPVWVRPASTDGMPAAGLLLVDGDGWNLAAMGDGWTVEHIGEPGTDSDRFAYVVETVQAVNETGQVNTPDGRAAGGLVLTPGTPDIAAGATLLDIRRPPGATRLSVWGKTTGVPPAWTVEVRIGASDGSLEATAATFAGPNAGRWQGLAEFGLGSPSSGADPAPYSTTRLAPGRLQLKTNGILAGVSYLADYLWSP